MKKTFILKKQLEKKAISFIILKNYFVDKSYKRHVLTEFNKSAQKKTLGQVFIGWKSTIDKLKTLNE